MRMLRKTCESFLDILLPHECALCGSSTLVGSRGVCDACEERLQVLRAVNYCRRCGVTTGRYASGGSCSLCKSQPAATSSMVRYGPFEGDLADMIRLFKFRGVVSLAPELGRLLSETMLDTDWLKDIDVLTWVPTSWRHRLMRPGHAATEIAPWVAHDVGLPLKKLLHRKGGGTHQVGLKRSQRIENVKGRFVLVPGARMQGATIGLIDDVATTNATLFECARVLKRAGARRVFGAVVAHAGGVSVLPSDA